jgi:hypothetical protein
VLDEEACSHCGGHIAINQSGLVYPHKIRRIRSDKRAPRATPVEYITTKNCPGGGWRPTPLERIPTLLAAIKYPHMVQQQRKDEVQC